jgi:hypothetical protein
MKMNVAEMKMLRFARGHIGYYKQNESHRNEDPGEKT